MNLPEDVQRRASARNERDRDDHDEDRQERHRGSASGRDRKEAGRLAVAAMLRAKPPLRRTSRNRSRVFMCLTATRRNSSRSKPASPANRISRSPAGYRGPGSHYRAEPILNTLKEDTVVKKQTKKEGETRTSHNSLSGR